MDIDLKSIRVRLQNETECAGYQAKDFTLMSLLDDYELSVRLIFCPSWPHHCSPLATATDLIRVVSSVKQRGPLVVVDRFGGTEAATFCALTTVLKQLDFENHVDVYQYAKVAHNRRPGIWNTQDDYLYLYRVCESVCHDLEKKNGSFMVKHNDKNVIMSTVTPYTNGNNHVTRSAFSPYSIRIPPEGMESAQSNDTIRI